MSENMITQSYVGQISVLGECFCYGAAIDDQQLVYLDIAGSATSVEAVWAKLAQAKECFIILPGNADKITLRSDKEKLKRLERKVEGVGIYHLLLLHRDFEPQYAELTRAYVFQTSDAGQTIAKIGSHIQQLMDIAVFPIWYPYIIQEGIAQGLIKPLKCFGAVCIQRIDLDKTAWERLICEALADRQIRLP